ncbi:hypothetical protein GIB67_008987 [Kingdonia uniflora]|uniref:Uncharacterized protein n=1 Tax=Kingdonia uniflora TaxID=39325 RepID=A0A7J7LVK5_9MAGN|nr:hypothetical protein GIB67_008987 [Kingdonia uniflora]
MLKLPHAFLFSRNGGGVIHGNTCEAIVCTLATKAAKLVGISPSNFRPIATSSSADFALSLNDVRMAMEQDLANGIFPLFLCATIGTTTAGVVDPVIGLGLVARDYCVWIQLMLIARVFSQNLGHI